MDIVTLAKAKKLIDSSIAGIDGVLAGKNCKIQSVEDITNGHRITFSWNDDEDIARTTSVDVMDGNSLENIDIKYAVSEGGTTPPSGWWYSYIPPIPDGYYLWTRNTLTFTNGETKVEYLISKQGVDGVSPTVTITDISGGHEVKITDKDGNHFFNVMDGLAIDFIDVDYAESASGTVAPAAGWQSNPPEVATGNFLWTRNTTHLMDGTTSVAYMVALQGAEGVSPTVEITPVSGGNRVVFTDKDGSHPFTVLDGVDGVDGRDGADGNDGFSPIITTDKVGKTTTITIVDADGTKYATVLDGIDGKTITNIIINSQNHVIVTYSDGTTSDAGELIVQSAVMSVNGQTGDVELELPDVVNVGANLSYNSQTNTISADAQSIDIDSEISSTSENPVQNKVIKSALDDKVDKVSGKGLSTNDYTTAEKDKLSGIASGAEVNVQSDWNQTDTTADDYIKNKPDISAMQLQSDWNQSDITAKDYIKNKPNFATVATSGSYDDLSNKPSIPAEQVNSDWNSTSGVSKILNKPTLGTAASKNVPSSGNASSTEVVMGNDSRLTNARTPTAHTHTKSEITDFPALGTAAAKNSTNTVAENSTDLVESGAVKTAIDSAISRVYKPAGNKTVAQLTNALLINTNLGNVYNILDSGTTTSDFVEGAGKTIELGDNVAVVDVGTSQSPSYKFDLLSGMVDLTNYIQKSQTAGLIKNDGSVDTTSYAKQSEMSVTNGSGANADKVTIQLKSGTSATVLKTHQDISGKVDKVDGKGLSTNDFTTTDKTAIRYYGTCSTSRAINAKVVTCENFVLEVGCKIVVKFTDTAGNAPTSGNITLNINGTGAKNVYNKNNTQMTYSHSGEFRGNRYCEFTYDGTNFIWLNYDSNSTYSTITQAEITAGTSTSSRLVTPKLLVDNFVKKESGKGLSTNDFTDTLKTKLEGIENGAEVNTITGIKGDSESTYRVGNVNITKANIGLGNVVNTGDSATPVSGGTTKFTTGGAFTELAKKVDKVDGKGLSTNDYTTTEKNKLAGIASGAEVNVQSDWNQTDNTKDDFIKNKPTLGTAAAKNVPSSGNASTSQVVMGNDTRLSDARTPTSHTHTKSQITDFPTLATVATSGSYDDLTDKPTIPPAITVDSALSSTSTNPVQNKVINTALNGKVGTGRKVNGHALSADVTVTKSDVGLGSVVDTGDSATPVSGGTTKFTTGGAYTELAKKVNNADSCAYKYYGSMSGSTKYVTITFSETSGAIVVTTGYSSSVIFDGPGGTPFRFASSSYGVDGYAWRNESKTLYLRLKGYRPIAVLLPSIKRTEVGTIGNTGIKVNFSDATTTAPSEVTFLTTFNQIDTVSARNTALESKQDTLTFSAPLSNSSNTVSISDFTAATSTSAAGKKGTVPAPSASTFTARAQTFLTANGGWRTLPNIAVCETAAGTTAKVATMSGFVLVIGAHFPLYLYVANTVANATLNVNSTGAKPILVNGAAVTASNLTAGWYDVVYDGTNFRLKNTGTQYMPNSINAIALSSSYTCSTAAGTAAKVLTIPGTFTLQKGARVVFSLTNANSATGPLTLNVNGTGAKTLIVNGTTTSASSYTMAASTYVAMYDGTNWRVESGARSPFPARSADSVPDRSFYKVTTGVGLGYTYNQDVHIKEFVRKLVNTYGNNIELDLQLGWSDANKVNLIFVSTTIDGYLYNSEFYKTKSGSSYTDKITPTENQYYIDVDTSITYRYVSGEFKKSDTLSIARIATSGISIRGYIKNLTNTATWQDVNLVINTGTTQYNCRITVSAIAGTYTTALSTVRTGTISVSNGGTGLTTMSYKNAVPIGNSTTVTSAMQAVRTASGAFYATAQDAKPQFGTLPVAQGGTGQTSAQAIVDETIQTGIAPKTDATSDVTDSTEIITSNVNGYSTTNKRLYRRTADKIWNYIKTKLGISTGTTSYLRNDGTWATPDDHITTASTTGTGNAVTAISADANGALTVTKGSTFLTSHQTVKQDGVTGATVNRFGTCSTAAATAAKTVSITTGTFTLEAGARVSVKFSNANTADNPTLNVNSKGAKNIFHKGAQITTGDNKALLAGVCDFIYDGTQWHLVGNYINTTYESKAAASSGTDLSLVTTGEKYTWGNKVDKVSGKGLSTNDFTTALKTKLENMGTNDGIVFEIVEYRS